MEHQNANGRIAKNTIALYVRMGVTMVISFFTARVTLQVLGVEDYGLNNLVGSVVSLLSFINGSMGTAVQRFYSYEIGKKNEGALSKIFGVGLYLHLIVALVTLLLAEIFAIFFLHKLNIPPERMMAAQVVFQISVLSMLLSIINVPYAAFLRAKEQFSKMAMVEIAQSLLRLGVLYLLYTINYDKLITLSLLNLCVSIFYITSLTILARRFDATKFRIIRDKPLIKEMLSFISFLLVTVLASLLRDKGVVILINLFFGLAINAAYAIAFQVMHLVNTFAMNFKQSVVPQIMSAYGGGDMNRMHRLIYSGTKVTTLLLLLISVPIAMESSYVLSLWLKDVPEYAAQLTVLVLINVNISSFSSFLYQGVHATGDIKKQQVVMTILYVLNVALVYLAFKMGLSFYYSVYVTIVISMAQLISNLYFAHKQISISIPFFMKEVLLKAILILAAMFLVCKVTMYFMDGSFIRFCIIFIEVITITFGLGWLYYLDKNERAGFLSIFKSLVNKTIQK